MQVAGTFACSAHAAIVFIPLFPVTASWWVIYAVEIYNSADGRLIAAYETKQYPGAMNINAAFGSLAAAKIGIDKGADALTAQLQ